MIGNCFFPCRFASLAKTRKFTSVFILSVGRVDKAKRIHQKQQPRKNAKDAKKKGN